jgi:hypothetical protein
MLSKKHWYDKLLGQVLLPMEPPPEAQVFNREQNKAFAAV